MRSLLFFLLLVSLPAALHAQVSPPLEVGVAYNYGHSNAPVAGCGCFNLQGGSGTLLWTVSPHFEPLAKVSVTRANGVDGTTSNVQLASYLFGARSLLLTRGRFSPYAEAAVGITHATGTLVTRSSPDGGNTNTIATTLGGGLRVNLSRYFALQAVQADYYLTNVPNGSNNHQNNLLVSSGIILKF